MARMKVATSLATKRARRDELQGEHDRLESDTASLREQLGRAVADGQDATAIRKRLRDAGEDLDGTERALELLDGEIVELEAAEHTEAVEAARTDLQRREDAAVAAIAQLDEQLRAWTKDTLLPAYAALRGAIRGGPAIGERVLQDLRVRCRCEWTHLLGGMAA